MKWLLAVILFLIFNTTAISTSPASTQEKRCLAEAIFRESRGEPYLGQLAVGQVVLNRVKLKFYPNSICQVIFQKGQFPWTINFNGFKATNNFIKVAEKVLSGRHELSNFEATHFHALYVNPKWKLTKVGIIGNHIFYKL